MYVFGLRTCMRRTVSCLVSHAQSTASRDMHTPLQIGVLAGKLLLYFVLYLLPLLQELTLFSASSLLSLAFAAAQLSGLQSAVPFSAASPVQHLALLLLLPPSAVHQRVYCHAAQLSGESLLASVAEFPPASNVLTLTCIDYVAQDFRCHCGSVTQQQCTAEVRLTSCKLSHCEV